MSGFVYVNLYKLSWPSEGPKDGQIITYFNAWGDPIYGPARWEWPSPKWELCEQIRAECWCPLEEIVYYWEGKVAGIHPHVNAHTRDMENGGVCEAGRRWLSFESRYLIPDGLKAMPEEYLESLITTYGDWIPPYNGEKLLSDTPLREGFYLVIEDREAHRSNFYWRGYELRE